MTTTTLKAVPLAREFYYNGTRIPDPNPKMSIEEVQDFLTAVHPEIATATVTGPEETASGVTYNFTRAIGSKG